MRVAIVPAQITTVEDKIFSNISVKQGMLLGTPVLVGFCEALMLQPYGRMVPYKIALSIVALVVCGILAIRIQDRIIWQWLTILTRYCMRPECIVYDKNTMYMRGGHIQQFDESEPKAITVKSVTKHTRRIPQQEFIRLEQLARDSRAKLRFEVDKKGELNVHFTEIK
jgi:hypothetical protein